jgi:tRNA pseudouridine(38-40) synthase
MKRYFITLSYNGKNYVGWQIQPNGLSVQEALQHALSVILREPVEVVGAGRTDAGVHAHKMVAHFDLPGTDLDATKLVRNLNSFLPRDISVQAIRAEEYILNKLSAVSDQLLDKRVYILRPCMIHGPGNKGNLNLLYSVVRKGIPWPLGSYENLRSFCSIDNISYVVEQLIVKENIASGIYHVGDDEPLSTNELIGLISKSVGKKSRIWKLPKGLMDAAARVGSVLHLPLNKDRLQKLTENYVVSNVKIKQALGIEKMPVSAKEGMRKTLESFR